MRTNLSQLGSPTVRVRRSAFLVQAQAHRAPGLIQQNPDVVLRLELGDLESGTHEDLLAAHGTYAELFTLQASPYQ